MNSHDAECTATPDEESGPQGWTAADAELAALAKALGHPARARIVRFLVRERNRTCICGDICDALPLAQSTVSQHLKALKDAGLIMGHVDGPRVCYCIDPRALQRLRELVDSLLL